MLPNFGEVLPRSDKVSNTCVLTTKLQLTIFLTNTRLLPSAVFPKTCGFASPISNGKPFVPCSAACSLNYKSSPCNFVYVLPDGGRRWDRPAGITM